jgi:hypothetical protein
MALIDDVATYLAAGGIGAVGTNIFKSYKADGPDAQVVVLDTGGPAPDSYIPTKNPTFQIYVRAKSYSLGRAKIDAIVSLLHRAANFTSGSTYFYFVLALQEPGHLGVDEKGRDEFSVNFQCKTR